MRILARAITMLAVGCAMGVAAQSRSNSTEAELSLLESVNHARKDQGLPGLHWNNELASAARKHAGVMAQHGSAEHGFPGEPGLAARATQAGAKFSWLSENVCEGARVEAIEEQFMNSPKHRANILDSDMDSVGIGVVERDGQLFAVEDFAKAK
ncbi:MAG TPA: CAP domain-containing protein [Candidatus Sulfotelmatobacter sp.]|jgi:uncharacterized protein YkwD